MGENEYREIGGFPGYRVGGDGSVWTAWAYNGHQPRKIGASWKRMRPQANADSGHLTVKLYRDGRARVHLVHVLVLTAFVGPKPTGMEGCHNDGKPAHCAVGNLRWDTHLANQRDRVAHGTVPRGTKSGTARLDEAKVQEIRARLAGGERQADIATAFGVARTTVTAIKGGRLWGWLESRAASERSA